MSASATRVSLGIDFGTSNTVSILERPGRPPTPLLFDGSPVLPSAVFASGDRLLVGRDAERAAMSDPAAFEPHPKRCLADGTVLLGRNEYPAVDLATAVLSRVAVEARRVAGVIPETVVLTHPAGWANERLRLLTTAARRAGLPSPRFASEPVAAATHFVSHLGHTFDEGSHIVVYDLGGGTFDVSVVRMSRGGLEVAATGGLPDVGGVDIDFAIVRHLEQTYPGTGDQWRRLREPETPVDRRHRRGLWRDVRDAKEILSRESAAALFIPILDVDAHLTREELETLARPLLRETVSLTLEVLAGAQISLDSVAGVFLVGGASRMPLSSTLLLRETRIAPTVLEQPELVVAGGAIEAPGRETTGQAEGGHTMISAMPPVVVATQRRPVYRGVAKVPVARAEPEAESVAHAVVSIDTGSPAAPTSGPPATAPVSPAPANPTTPVPAPFVPVSPAAPPPAPMTTVPAAAGPVTGLAVSGDGTVAIARPDSVTVTDPDHPATTVVVRESQGPIVGVDWAPDGEGLLAVASGDIVTVWRHRDNVLEAVRTLTCPDKVKLLSWSPGGLATAMGTEILVWDPSTGECRRAWRFSSGPEGSQLRALAWLRDGGRLAAGGSLGTIKVFNATQDNPAMVLNCAPVSVRALAFAPGGDWLVSGDAAGGLRIWRLSDGSDQHLRQAHDAAVQTVAWSPDGKLLASGGIDGRVRLWDAGSGREHLVLSGHTDVITAVCWSPDGHRIHSAAADGTVRSWGATSGSEVGIVSEGE